MLDCTNIVLNHPKKHITYHEVDTAYMQMVWSPSSKSTFFHTCPLCALVLQVWNWIHNGSLVLRACLLHMFPAFFLSLTKKISRSDQRNEMKVSSVRFTSCACTRYTNHKFKKQDEMVLKLSKWTKMLCTHFSYTEEITGLKSMTDIVRGWKCMYFSGQHPY